VDRTGTKFRTNAKTLLAILRSSIFTVEHSARCKQFMIVEITHKVAKLMFSNFTMRDVPYV